MCVVCCVLCVVCCVMCVVCCVSGRVEVYTHLPALRCCVRAFLFVCECKCVWATHITCPSLHTGITHRHTHKHTHLPEHQNPSPTHTHTHTHLPEHHHLHQPTYTHLHTYLHTPLCTLSPLYLLLPSLIARRSSQQIINCSLSRV